MKNWDEIFRKKGAVHKKPLKSLIELIPVLKKNKVKKILDVGCGVGRHLLLLKNKGFDIYGCDISNKAIRESSKIIGKEKVKKSDMSRLNYKDSSFDCLVSIQVLQHGNIGKIKKAINEAYRVLRKNGFLFIHTLSTSDAVFKSGKEIEPNTKINTKQIDGKLIHHFFTKSELRNLLSDFDLIYIKKIKRKSVTIGKIRTNWVVLARKK